MKLPLAILFTAAVAFGQQAPTPAQGPPPRNLTQRADGHFTANQDPANPENFEVHTVVAGETLSGIAGRVLNNPRLWPQLWEENDHIVNPHWIYPNDKILIRPLTPISAVTPPAAPEAAPPARSPIQLATAPPPPVPPANMFDLSPARIFPEVKPDDLYCSGFIRAAAVPDDMKVVARFNSDNALLAGEGDYIYVNRGLESGVRPGGRYQVVRPTKKVEGPGRTSAERAVGTHHIDVGQIHIVLAQDDFALARVLQSCEAIEVGDFILPYQSPEFPASLPSKRPFSPMMTASGGAPGQIISTRSALTSFGSAFKGSNRIPGVRKGQLSAIDQGVAAEGGIVYINVGRDAGIRPGDFFIVFRNVDVEDDALIVDRDRVRQQRTAIGEIVILKVEDRASTALVTYSTDGLYQGDAVERR